MRRWRGLLLVSALVLGAGGASGCADDVPPGGEDPVDAGPGEPDGDPTAAIFDPMRVLEVEIEMAPADWDALRRQTRAIGELLGGTDCLADPFGSPFAWFHARVTVDGQNFEDVGVRKKGFLGSLSDTRPSLKIGFDEWMPGQKLHGAKGLTLNNNQQDPSLVRTCLGYLVMARAGVPAPRCTFARVTVNGQDLGVYTNVEAVNKAFLRRHWGTDDGNLYEGTLSDFRPEWMGTFEKETNEAAADFSDLAALTDALELPDAQLLAAVEPLVDVEAFLTFWAGESLVRHWDGYAGNTNNFFVYVPPATGRFEFVPWGMDAVMQLPAPGEAPLSVQAVGMLARRLYDVPETRGRYVARLHELLAGAWDEELLGAELDRIEALITPYVPEAQRFDVAASIEEVREFVRTRRAAIEAELAAGPPAWTQPLRDPPCFEEIGSASGSFSTTFGTLEAPNPFATGTGTLDATLHGSPVAVTATGAKAGFDPDSQNPERPQVHLVVRLADNTFGVVFFDFDPASFAPATLPLDWRAAFGLIYHFDPATNTGTLVGIFGAGTVTLTKAAPTPGAPVEGAFSATVVRWPF